MRPGRILAAVAFLALAGLASWATSSPAAQDTSGLAAMKAAYRHPDPIEYPEDNPFSEAKEKLGRKLFFDQILSLSRTYSCASCHNPDLGWSDGLRKAIGFSGAELSLHAPTLLNIAWIPILGWDGRFQDLESVTFAPISAPLNMGLPKQMLIDRLTADPAYVSAFTEAFGKPEITERTIEQALTTFERTIISDESPFDRWIGGDEGAISDAAKRGFALFNGRAYCAECHAGWAFTDGSFHDIGVARGDDLGRGRFFPSSVKLQYAFKTPTLRDVAKRAPYMHDGSVPTLKAVVDHYDQGGIERPSRAEPIMKLQLSVREKSDLVAFLKTLTGDRAKPVEPH
ncbi:MAG: c-type cytochrome [Acetobacteraceae bacterium]|nr:c-type cytochrome [Acetobacteraceae bacterium]